MQLSDIDPSLRPENAPPKQVLQSFHNALKNRYYYLMFPIVSPIILPFLSRITKLFGRQFVKDYSFSIPIIFLLFYINSIDVAISLFSFGSNNRFDPLRTLIVSDARMALRTLMQKAPGIYENNVYRMLEQSPQYTNPNLTIETSIASIDQEAPYTPLKLAKELGAKNIADLFDRKSYENQIICLLLRAFISQKGSLANLNSHVITHILSFFAGSEICDLKNKAQDTELEAITSYTKIYAQKQRDNLPKFLAYFESKKTKLTLDNNLETKKPKCKNIPDF